MFADKLFASSQDLRLCFPKLPSKGHWLPAIKQDSTQKVLQRIQTQIEQLSEVVKVHLSRDEELDKIYDRLIEIKGRFARMITEGDEDVSLWFETTQRHIAIKITPLSVAKKFRKIWQEGERSWIFTSATLSVNENFNHFKGLLGLDECHSLTLQSPFNYQEQSILCVPRYLPAPQQKEFIPSLAEVCKQLVVAAKGRCFLLFTSHYALREVAALLREQVTNPLLVQGEISKSVLLSQYLQTPEAVLLGTGAFWEGVDVKGNDLVCVLIDKLPFATPGDPLLDARMQACRKQGKDPFQTLQLPQAVISLKQGAGRLIRDITDQGVLVICDNRLVNREYGSIFVNSLPKMKRTRNINQAIEFIEKINE
jgi:ATP-dependent DNA helicase DinG